MFEAEPPHDAPVPQEPTPLAVRLGEPFLLPLRLSGSEQEYEDGDARLETVPIAVAGVGPGRIIVYRDGLSAREAAATVGAVGRARFRTPAGPLSFRTVLSDGRVALDPASMPVSLYVYLDAVPAQLLPTETEEFLRCTLTYAGTAYTGIPSIDTVQTGPMRELAFLRWTEEPDSPTAPRLALLFPQDPAVLRRVLLTVSLEP